jgi:hypothetical protein
LGKNARKPSNKSSCPARLRRTLSTTTSTGNLRARTRTRASVTTLASHRSIASRRVASRPRTFPA